MWPDYYLWPRYRQIFCNCPPWQQCHAFIVQKMQYFSRTNNSRLYSVFKTLPLWVSWSNFCALFHLVIPFFFFVFYFIFFFSSRLCFYFFPFSSLCIFKTQSTRNSFLSLRYVLRLIFLSHTCLRFQIVAGDFALLRTRKWIRIFALATTMIGRVILFSYSSSVLIDNTAR